MGKPSLLRRIMSAIWRRITRVRLAMSNILFLVMIALIYFLYIGGAPEPLPDKAALLLNMSGTVVDQRSAVNPLEAVLAEPTPEQHELGGYETWLGTNRMEIEASNKLLDALLTMAAEIAAPSK